MNIHSTIVPASPSLGNFVPVQMYVQYTLAVV